QSDIFNAFAQEDTSTTRRFGGTGLGLSICRCLVQLMGGEIGVVSELGKGSEFWFTLPVVQIEPLDYVQPTMIFQNVLIADDHPVAREVLVAIVRSLGWIPEVVSSGEEAVRRTLERAQNNKLPDLLLLDWRMPGTDGLAAASQITQALGNIPNRPFVVIATAHDHELLAKEPGAEVADAILSKPLTASALYNAVIEKQRSLEKVTVLSDSEIDVSGRRIQGLRILVVDDSEINRDMARRILEQEGANVDLVDDGQSAVDWLRVNSDQTDVVLMDIQMPLMDGYEATRQIREILKLTTLPIIALTAGAFKNQQTAALQAGMNGFVAKPFDVDELITLLRQYLGDQPSENPVSISHGDNPSPDKSVRVIDWERGLRNWGDQMTYHNYLRKFIDAHSKDGDHIKALISSFDTDRARVLAHKLKGTAGNLAIMQVWALAEQIESLLSEDGNVADYPHELQLALDTVASELSALAPPTAEASEAVTDVADRESAVKLLRELLLALDRDNPDEAEPSLIALQSMLPIQMLTPIREQLDSFDFRAAELQTQALIKEINLTLEEV
ncbi:MAG: response regulator, partial [Gammaproteobacteria bacterium]